MEKYEILTQDKIKIYDDKIVYRIRALKNFSDVKTGDLGGYVENPSNLSQEGDCWIYDTATAYDSARVSGNAKVYNGSAVFELSILTGNCKVYKSKISGDSKIDDNAVIYGCKVYNSQISGESILHSIK